MPEKPDSPAELAKKQQEAQRQLVLDYKATFAGSKGQSVLADLKRAFAFEKWEASDSTDADVIARRVCMKGPIYHIERMLKTTFQEKPVKPSRALSEGTP